MLKNFIVCTGGENWSRVVATALDPRKHDFLIKNRRGNEKVMGREGNCAFFLRSYYAAFFPFCSEGHFEEGGIPFPSFSSFYTLRFAQKKKKREIVHLFSSIFTIVFFGWECRGNFAVVRESEFCRKRKKNSRGIFLCRKTCFRVFYTVQEPKKRKKCFGKVKCARENIYRETQSSFPTFCLRSLYQGIFSLHHRVHTLRDFFCPKTAISYHSFLQPTTTEIPRI